jgi:hypothetical protein
VCENAVPQRKSAMPLPCVAPPRGFCVGARLYFGMKVRGDHRHSRFHTPSAKTGPRTDSSVGQLWVELGVRAEDLIR